jgi:putative iron-dependent peroxidase
MATPQPGIFALGTRTHHHLELDVATNASDADVVDALRSLSEPHVTAGATNLVIGYGPEVATRLLPIDEQPEDLAAFGEVHGLDGKVAPATQHDLWVWVHGAGADSVHDTAVHVAATLAPVATVAQETACWVYHDSRDLTGFIDGTANPPPSEAPSVALVPDGRPGAGGSHVLAQRWVHDLSAFSELAVADQERVIGRTKLDSVELPSDLRPSDAHISLAEIHDADGEEREIYRRSIPYGTTTERGLYFLAFSAERDRFDEMLAQLFGAGERTRRDRLLDFTTPVSGAYYFAPASEALPLGEA